LTVACSFAELSRKYPYPQTPAISRGHIRRKANTRDPQSLIFGSLAAAFWNLFLGTKAVLGTASKDVLHPGCGEASPLEAQPLPMKGIEGKGKCPKYSTTQ
jgi:hypothetical protein